jgi:hypothetical protein
MSNPGRIVYGLLAAVVFLPSTLNAQPTDRFEDLQHKLKAGQTVVITDANGGETRGKLTSISSSSLEVLSDEKRAFEKTTVREVRKIDSVWNGVLIGAAAGGAVAVVGFLATQGSSDSAYGWAYIGSWLAPVGGALGGYFIDKQVGNGPMYRAPAGGSNLSLMLAADPRAERCSIGIALRF